MTAVDTTPAPWMSSRTHRSWLDAELRRLLAFGRRSGLPGGGAAYLGGDGSPLPQHGTQTWITARTVHVYSLGSLLGVPGSGPVADAALAGLTGPLRDEEHGGWFHALLPDGRPDEAAGKSCYDHAFVMLAASSALVAGRPGARDLLAEATELYLRRYWDESVGRPVDAWDRDFTTLDPYRGLNGTMHSVEAMLSVADAVPDSEATPWRERALRAVQFVARLARDHDGRLPEHFGPAWIPDLELNRARPGDQFKPFGATPGHGLEWARLILHAEAATAPDEALVETAVGLFDRAVSEAWAIDGADGFVYTTDWDGTPVVRERMHWVTAEAISAAACLLHRTNDSRFAEWYATWWDYAERYLLDHDRGSWFHELDTDNRPAGTVWPGKPDLYHAVQATLVPRLPLRPMLARAVADGHLA